MWRLHLLPQSDAVMHDIEAVATSVREDCLAGIDADELETALKVLGQIRENLSLLDRASRAESSLRKS